MLDIVRRSKGFTRVILSIVVVAVAGTFGVALYGIWGGGLTDAEQGAPDWIAVVDGERIPASEFQQNRAALERDIRERLGDQPFDEATLGALVDRQALGTILGTFLAQKEADREGLRVTPGEVSEAIMRIPVFRRDGRFIGVKEYRDLLRAQGLDMVHFERQLARELAADKVRRALAALVHVDEREVERRFSNEVIRADVNYVLVADADHASRSAPGEAELRVWFAARTRDYMTPEKRDTSFVLFDRETRAASMEVSEEDLRQRYESEKATRYTHGEERRASHILFRLDPGSTPDEEAAKERSANEALAAVRSGQDFAEAAGARSEDPTTAPVGGDLGWFEKGRMVKEFEDTAFALATGAVSGVVRTPFGFHIIKTTDSRPPGTRPYEDVREEIRRGIAVQRAQDEIRAAADAFTTRLASQESSFESTAGEMGLTVERTGPVARGGPAGRLGRLPMAEDAIFSLSPGGNSAAVSVPQGLAVFHLDTIAEPQPEAFESVRERVEEDWKTARAREQARAAAEKIARGSGDLRSRIAGTKLAVASLAAVTRGQPMPPLTDAAKDAAFSSPSGSVVGPFDTADGLVLLEVTRMEPSTAAAADAERATLRTRLLEEEQDEMYRAMMTRLERNSQVEINYALTRVGAASQ